MIFVRYKYAATRGRACCNSDSIIGARARARYNKLQGKILSFTTWPRVRATLCECVYASARARARRKWARLVTEYRSNASLGDCRRAIWRSKTAHTTVNKSGMANYMRLTWRKRRRLRCQEDVLLSSYPRQRETPQDERETARESLPPTLRVFVTRTRDTWNRERCTHEHHHRVQLRGHVVLSCERLSSSPIAADNGTIVPTGARDVRTASQSRTHRLPWKRALSASVARALLPRLSRRRAASDRLAIEQARRRSRCRHRRRRRRRCRTEAPWPTGSGEWQERTGKFREILYPLCQRANSRERCMANGGELRRIVVTSHACMYYYYNIHTHARHVRSRRAAIRLCATVKAATRVHRAHSWWHAVLFARRIGVWNLVTGRKKKEHFTATFPSSPRNHVRVIIRGIALCARVRTVVCKTYKRMSQSEPFVSGPGVDCQNFGKIGSCDVANAPQALPTVPRSLCIVIRETSEMTWKW